MSLKTEFNNMAQDLIENVFDSVSRQVSLNIYTTGYDVYSGDIINSEPTTYILKAIVGPFIQTRTEVSDAEVNDLRAVIAHKSLPNQDIFLQVDQIVIEEKTYDLIDKSIDATESVIILQLRER